MKISELFEAKASFEQLKPFESAVKKWIGKLPEGADNGSYGEDDPRAWLNWPGDDGSESNAAWTRYKKRVAAAFVESDEFKKFKDLFKDKATAIQSARRIIDTIWHDPFH